MDRREMLKKAGAAIGLGVIAASGDFLKASGTGTTDDPLKLHFKAPPPLKGICIVRYPPGGVIMPDGTQVSNEKIARQLAEQMHAGAMLTMPNTRDEYGEYEWDFRIEGGDQAQVKVERKKG